MYRTERSIRSTSRVIAPILLGLFLAACGGVKIDSSSSACSLGTNVATNTDLSVRLINARNLAVPPINCRVPITMIFRQSSFFIPNYIRDMLTYYDMQGASLFIRIAETQNNGNQWPAPNPEDAFAIGEKIADIAKGRSYPINIILWNEPNLHSEWSKQANPEAFADVLVALVNGLNRSDDRHDNVHLYLPPLSFCNKKCNELGIEPKVFYNRLYRHLEEKLTSGMTDPEYKRLLVQQWIKQNFHGFVVNIYPDDKYEAVHQMRTLIDLWHESGLVRDNETPRIFVSEIGLPGGKVDRSAGKNSCDGLDAIHTQFPHLSIVGATVYARDDGEKQTSLYLPKHIGFVSQDCSFISIAE